MKRALPSPGTAPTARHTVRSTRAAISASTATARVRSAGRRATPGRSASMPKSDSHLTSLPPEPMIIINGAPLSTAQAMTIRVALQSFLSEIAADPDALGDDEHGRAMRAAYLNRGHEINQIMSQARLDVTQEAS